MPIIRSVRFTLFVFDQTLENRRRFYVLPLCRSSVRDPTREFKQEEKSVELFVGVLILLKSRRIYGAASGVNFGATIPQSVVGVWSGRP